MEEKAEEILQEQKVVERRKLNIFIFKAPGALEEAFKVEETHHDILFMKKNFNSETKSVQNT